MFSYDVDAFLPTTGLSRLPQTPKICQIFGHTQPVLALKKIYTLKTHYKIFYFLGGVESADLIGAYVAPLQMKGLCLWMKFYICFIFLIL